LKDLRFVIVAVGVLDLQCFVMWWTQTFVEQLWLVSSMYTANL